MEADLYKKLYYHAFNRLTDLAKEIEHIQQELEEIYLKGNDPAQGTEQTETKSPLP